MSAHERGAIPTNWFRVYVPFEGTVYPERQVGRWLVDLGDRWRRGYNDVALAVVDDFGNLVAV